MKISLKRLSSYREETYCLKAELRLKSLQEAQCFVKQRGFVFFWPIKGIELPSLWNAVAGNRPVADQHDDPGHITWGWKDDSLGRNIWYYGKILRKKATMIALDIAPYFYALSRNFGSPQDDIAIDFYEGYITREAKMIFDVLLKNGPMDTITLRQAVFMTGKQSSAAFDRAIAVLQSEFKILPVGISDSGGWHYAFIYDLVHQQFPDLPVKAQHIPEQTARRKLLQLYLKSVGAASYQDVIRLFGWHIKETRLTIDSLAAESTIIKDVENPTIPGDWLALEDILQ